MQLEPGSGRDSSQMEPTDELAGQIEHFRKAA